LRDAAAAPAATARADLARGELVYEETCVICHGVDGKGGHGGGAPLDNVSEYGLVLQVLQSGRNSMPNFSGVLTDEQMRDVSAYVVERLSPAE
jgi:mono/diheme cytochrome c family protein